MTLLQLSRDFFDRILGKLGEKIGHNPASDYVANENFESKEVNLWL